MIILQYILFISIWLFAIRAFTIVFDFIMYLIYSPLTEDSALLLADFMSSLSNEIMFIMIASGAYCLSIKQWILGILCIGLFYPVSFYFPYLFGIVTLRIQFKIKKVGRNIYKNVRPDPDESSLFLSGQKYGISIACIPIVSNLVGVPTPIFLTVIFSIFGLILWGFCTHAVLNKLM